MTAESDGSSSGMGETAGGSWEGPALEWLETSDRHRLLASVERRLTLEVLSGSPGSVGLEELAAAVVARARDDDVAGEADAGTGGADADGEAVDAVATSLHHVHLPFMDRLGVLGYDADANRVVGCRVGPGPV